MGLIALIFIVIENFGIITLLKRLNDSNPTIANRLQQTKDLYYIRAIALLFISMSVIFYREIIKGSIGMFELPGYLFSKIRSALRGCNSIHRTLLFAIISAVLIFRIFWIIKLPITHDEAATFVNQTSRGIHYALSYYPAPNNHIFNSILTWFTSLIPIDAKLSLRIPSLVFGMLSAMAFGYLGMKMTNKNWIVILGLVLFCFGTLTTEYGILARGYAMVLTSFIVVFYFSHKWIVTNNKIHRLDKYLYGICIIIGYWSVPTFLYAHIAVTLSTAIWTGFRRNFIVLGEIVKVNFIAMVTALALYMPVILISGSASLFDNDFVGTLNWKEFLSLLPNHLLNTIHLLFNGQPIWLGILILLILSLKRWDVWIVLSLILILTAPVLIVIHRVIPFERTWIYLYVPMVLLIMQILSLNDNIIHKAVRNKKSRTLFGVLTVVLLTIGLVDNFQRTILQSEMTALELSKYNEITRDKRVDVIYCSDRISETIIQYYFHNSPEKKVKYVNNVNEIPSFKNRDSGLKKTYYISSLEKNSFALDNGLLLEKEDVNGVYYNLFAVKYGE